MTAMKHYVCILVIALVHRAVCFPVGEPLASVGSSVPSLTPEMKGAEPKSDTPITPVVAGILPEKSDVFVAPVAPPQMKEVVSPSPVPAATAAATAAVVKDVVPVVPTSPDVAADEPSAANHKTETVVKSDAVKSEVHTPEVPVQRSETTEKIVAVEQVAVSSEKPKESNSQVNTVSVDEPKPVRNEVKSDIPKEAIADEQIKVEKMKDEKVTVGGDAAKSDVVVVVDQQAKSGEKESDEVKSGEKVETVKSAPAVNSGETTAMKPSSSEENVRKGGEGDVSNSEEKNTSSGERVTMSGEKRESDEKKNNSGEDGQRDSSEEAKEGVAKPAEKATEEPKKEEKKEETKKESGAVKDEKKELREEVSSAKPIAESPQAVEPVKPSTVVAAAAPVTGPATSMDAVTEKVDVIKREAAKDKHDEKKSTDIVKKDKSKVGSSAPKDDEIKSSKGQDKIVN